MGYKALRGAVGVDYDTPLDVDRAVKEMMDAVYSENGITDEDVAFLLFSQTVDIKSRNAATVFRKTGRGADVPLFCVQEAEVHGQLERVIRVLVSLKKEREDAYMVYLGRAVRLRPDIAGK